MSRYIGNYIRATSTEPTQNSTQGIWSLSDQLAYKQRDQWPPERDPYYNLTTLHLPGNVASSGYQATTLPVAFNSDSSTNKFLVTPVGDVRASSFSPYNTGYSTYFSSTSGLTISGLTSIGSGDVTIETFVYMTTLSGEQHMVQQGTSTTNILLSYDGVNSKLRFLVRNDSGSNNLDIYSPTAPPLNRWFHFAATVQGTTGRIWIDGQVVATGTVSGTRSGSQTFVYMGDNGSGGSRPFNGYLSNTRIVVGTAVYTANFIPPTTNLTSVAGTSLLTNQSNRFINLVDNVAATISQGSPRITSSNPYNLTDTASGSGYFDGNADYLAAGDQTAFEFGAGDYTVELWWYPTTTTDQNIIGKWDAGGSEWILQWRSLGYYRWASGGNVISDTSSITLRLNAWNHISVTKTSGSLRIYSNGSQINTTASEGTISATTAQLTIGTSQLNSSPGYVTGYISDVRIVKGTAIAPPASAPTAPLQAVSGTSLLTLQTRHQAQNSGFLDTSPNNFVITRNGNATQGSFSPFSPSGWSNYFAGSPDFLSGSGQLLGIGSNNFTVEAWVFLPRLDGVSSRFILGTSTTSSSPTGIYFSITPAGAITCAETWGINVWTSTGLTFLAGTWNHVALCRSGNTARVFLNGVPSTNTGSFSESYNSTAFAIGRTWTTDAANSSYMIGNISNLRVISGQALYSGNFTPPSAPLTTTQVGSTGAGAASSITGTVTLLTCQDNRFRDNSSYNRTISIGAGSPSVQAFSPFAPTSTYLPQTHGGSAYFDGTTDYLSVANSGLFGSGDWTIELWINAPVGQTDKPILECRNPASGSGTTTGFTLTLITSTEIRLFSGSQLLRGTVDYVNTWTHVAVSKKSGTTRLYLNGTSVASTASLGTMSDTSFIVGAGYYSSTSLTAFGQFYMSGLRVLTGTGYDTSTITIPTAPLTAIPNTSLLLNFTNAGIVDATGKNVVETVGNAHLTTSGTVPVSGTTGTLIFDGSDDNLFIKSNTDLNFGTSDWTIECWIYVSSRTTNYPLIFGNNRGSFTTDAIALTTSNADLASYNNKFCFAWGSSGFSNVSAGASQLLVANVTNSNATWYHFATVRTGTTVKMYRNGIEVASATVSSAAIFNFGFNGSCIGGGNWDGAQSYFNGYIKDIRITRYPRYTTNFTPTAKPLPIG